MRAIREAVDDSVTLRVDANQGWSVKDVVRAIQELALLRVKPVEQPIVHWDHAGLRAIRTSSQPPVVADESCHSPMDAAASIRPKRSTPSRRPAMSFACWAAWGKAASPTPPACTLGRMPEDVTFYTSSPHIKGGFNGPVPPAGRAGRGPGHQVRQRILDGHRQVHQ